MAIDVAEPEVGEDVEAEIEDVGVATSAKRGRRRAEDDPRQAFVFPVEMIDDKGKLTKWNSKCGFKFGSEDDCSLPVKRDQCANEEVFGDYRIAIKQYKVDELIEEITVMKKVRDQTASIENVVTRENAKRALILHKKLKAEMQKLSEDGVDWDALIGKSDA